MEKNISQDLFVKAFHLQRPTNPVCPLHVHFQVELIIVTAGVLDMTVAGKRYAIRRGQSVLVCPFEPHAFHGGEGAECFILEFYTRTVTYFSAALLRSVPKRRLLTLPEDLFSFSTRILGGAQTPEDEHRISKVVLYPIIYTYTEQGEMKERNFDDDMLRAVSLVYDGLDEEITLPDVASAVGIRPETLSRKFLKTTGLHFKAFVNALRVERAQELISQGQSMTEAAEASGFSSIRTFNRVFKQITGTVPSASDASFKMPRTSLTVREDFPSRSE